MINQRGYIALISTILMFFILLALTLTVSFVSFTHRMNILEAEEKAQSNALSSACVEQALLRLATNRDYDGGETLTLNGNTCAITSVQSASSGLNRVIMVTSSVRDAITTLRVEIALKNFSVISLEEVP